MRPLVSMREALADPRLLGLILEGPSWAAWRVLLIAMMGEALNRHERRVFESLTRRDREPRKLVEEFWGVIGRRGGKSRAMAVLAAYLGALVDYSDVLAIGERALIPVLAATTDQATTLFRYIAGIFEVAPLFHELVTNRTADTLSLSTRVSIEVKPANFRTVRSVTAVAAIADEASFWFAEDSANPDAEILNALRPALATTGGPLIVISSPYARRGEVYATWKRDFGPEGDPKILVVHGTSRDLNPTLPQRPGPLGVAHRLQEPLCQLVDANRWRAARRLDGQSLAGQNKGSRRVCGFDLVARGDIGQLGLGVGVERRQSQCVRTLRENASGLEVCGVDPGL